MSSVTEGWRERHSHSRHCSTFSTSDLISIEGEMEEKLKSSLQLELQTESCGSDSLLGGLEEEERDLLKVVPVPQLSVQPQTMANRC